MIERVLKAVWVILVFLILVVVCISLAEASKNHLEAARRADRYDSYRGECHARDCCSRKTQTLAADCFVFIPFLTATLSYWFAYVVARLSQVGCSSYATVNATSVSIVLSTTTGSITATSIVPSVVSVTTTLTIVEAAYQVSTTTQTVTFTTTPLVISVSTVVTFVTQSFTYVTCDGPPGKKRSIEYDDYQGSLEPLHGPGDYDRSSSNDLFGEGEILTALDSSLEDQGQRANAK